MAIIVKASLKDNGNFNNTMRMLRNSTDMSKKIRNIMKKYGQQGVYALSAATPRGETEETANSWYYELHPWGISWNNSAIAEGDGYAVPIVILLQYGHANRDGTRFEGVDFINPALANTFATIENDVAWEISNL